MSLSCHCRNDIVHALLTTSNKSCVGYFKAVLTLRTTSYDSAGCLDARCRTCTTSSDVIRCRAQCEHRLSLPANAPINNSREDAIYFMYHVNITFYMLGLWMAYVDKRTYA